MILTDLNLKPPKDKCCTYPPMYLLQVCIRMHVDVDVQYARTHCMHIWTYVGRYGCMHVCLCASCTNGVCKHVCVYVGRNVCEPDTISY